MQDYQKEFIAFAMQHGVLRFGSFKLKSGRQSPYFFNTGLFNSGLALARLGEFYARAIVASGVGFDLIYGPAYKGIPLGSSIAIAFATLYDRDVPFCFNRKEPKDHGEGGATLGAPLAGRVLIVDDVISAGTSVGESMAIINGAGANAVGVMISLDRQERGRGELSAVDDVKQRFGIPVNSILTLVNIIEFLTETDDMSEELAAIGSYRAQFGV
ncbi:MAG: orotate phosphoribosyltransferase [Gammaproteobacteria bacterium]|jgi:orotate phosphoribosyltransferase